MEEYRKLEQEYGAPLPMPTAAHVFPPTPPERYDTGNEHVDNMLNTAADVYARSELAAPQRFTVMETDDGYAVWDDIQDGIHVEPDGVSEEFTSEWEAETYRQQLIEKVQEREAKDWLYVEQSKQNLQQDIPFPDVESEEVQESAHAETDPLVLEMQEHASELSRESGYAPDERFVVTMTGENFPDSKDKKLLSIISAMLKAEVAGIGFPEKGTPQGGIISPLLSNIVLNELDWWIVSQWEEMPTQRNYVHRIYANGTPDKSSTIRTLRNYTNLKECYVVRYADDFKIFCKKRSDAIKLFEATKQWLLDRLGLEISPEKSKIVNLKRHYSEFLGFKLKVRTKGKKPDGQPRYVVEAHIKDKALQKIREKSKEIIGQIRQTYDPGMEYRLIQKYNSYVMGVHNYYSIATHVNIDFHKIAFDVKKSLYNRLKHRLQKKGQITNRYIKEKYGTSREVRYLNGHAIVPIAYVQHRVPMDKKSRVNKYTPEGRVEIHKNLAGINMAVLYHLMNNPCGKQSVEYNDNRIALYVAQKGKCAVSGAELGANQVDCHHKKPLVLGGNDSYQNLIIVSDVVHILIHSSNERTIRKYLKVLNPDKKQLAKLNKLRVMAEMPELVF